MFDGDGVVDQALGGLELLGAGHVASTRMNLDRIKTPTVQTEGRNLGPSLFESCVESAWSRFTFTLSLS